MWVIETQNFCIILLRDPNCLHRLVIPHDDSENKSKNKNYTYGRSISLLVRAFCASMCLCTIKQV